MFDDCLEHVEYNTVSLSGEVQAISECFSVDDIQPDKSNLRVIRR